MPESQYSIAVAERCRFVFQSHARAVVYLEELAPDEVEAFAALAVEKPADQAGQPPTLELAADASPRFRKIWRAHLERLKGTDDTDALKPEPAEEPPAASIRTEE
ncbi:hypothetical protein KOR34_02070 [Posidoniimonas corsicana]|uniref:Uncharacterized protein n=1 Tax=Posidoniimonas corsicana TaxID=1938618 RepID=A0A5C5VBH0_9BACT|nr:hypothetical protein [Posidoniimonas corsicana]TWT35317.1 hypothetical protein KOR34_02070 [Posidoniimonas corsicana]